MVFGIISRTKDAAQQIRSKCRSPERASLRHHNIVLLNPQPVGISSRTRKAGDLYLPVIEHSKLVDMLLKMIIDANVCITFLTKTIPKNSDAFRCPINFRERGKISQFLHPKIQTQSRVTHLNHPPSRTFVAFSSFPNLLSAVIINSGSDNAIGNNIHTYTL